MSKKSLVVFSLLYSIMSFAQTLTGTVQDSTGIALPYTNLIASPIASPDAQITFSISDELGRYKLELKKAIPYKIEITHMGFSKLTDTLQIEESTTKNYTLIESNESLEDVLVKAEMAVIVKEDTITYRTDQFKTGDERKLRDILKKLPGVEVDREGNVTVNGKPVTKLMVEGKEFFFGDPKLGVNNIPADAVDEVEVLDNYSEVAFLKGLKDSDKMALNIKLKEGKKKFAFGDLAVGGGHQDRYLVNPTLFYYSPKTSVNFIGDFNNAGQKSFSMSDYINFEGGYADMIDRPNAFSIYRDDFAQFLNQQDFVFNQNDFGAGSLSQDLGRNWQLDAYSIINRGIVETQNSSDITYQTGMAEDELRTQESEQEMLFSINKAKLRYDNIKDVDMFIDLLVKTSDADSQSTLNSLTASRENFVVTDQSPRKLDVSKTMSINKQFSYKHTTSINTKLQYVESENTQDWLFNQPVFSNLIPFQPDGDSFNLLQNNRTITRAAQIDVKHYWVLHNFHHIYPVVGTDYFSQYYGSNDAQILQDGSVNSFQEAGFNNDLDFRLLDAYAGFQYKTKIDKLTIRPGLIAHSFHWSTAQFDEAQVNHQKFAFLPELMMKYELNSSEKFNFDYNLRTQFGNVQLFANRLRLANFNSLYRGNEELENQLYHQYRLRYSNFNMFKGLFLNASLNYNRRFQSIRNQTEIEGIDQVNTSIYTDLPENSYSFNSSVSKLIRKLRLGISGGITLSDYSRIINDEVIDYNSNSYNYAFTFSTRFKEKWPNVELRFQQFYNDLSSVAIDNQFVQTSPNINVSYRFLEDFLFKADYQYNHYKNRTQNQSNIFEIGSASLLYGKEDSPWELGIEATNLFDVRFKNNNSVNQFLVNDQQIFIQPRIIMLKLNYRL
ncbi:TonB-dependent receptor [Psychroflexus planctonicus]|nr:TonB-dependent receptor [Psychroflexus planctonicus]